MKRISLFLFTLYLGAICAQQHTAAQTAPVPVPTPVPGGEYFRQEGMASWYGYEFDGRPTASGEIYNSSLLTAAHPTLPFGTYLLVTNRQNNRQVAVKVNDRGPFVAGRIIDLSRAAAEQLDMLITGTAPVLIDKIQASQALALPSLPPQPGYVYIQQAPMPMVYPQPVQPMRLPTVPPSQQVQVPVTVPVPTQAPLPLQYPVPVQAPLPLQYPVPVQAPLPFPYPVPAQGPLPLPTIVPTPPPGPPEQPAPSSSSITVTVYPPPTPQTPNLVDLPGGPRARLSPSINPAPNRIYKLQVGSYKIAGNAVETYLKLKAVGLDPSYERKDEYFRVVLAGVCGTDVISVTEKLGMAGFREAVIREER